ncbi:MAG: tRNA glutamyl-Q(34) synthetase GluQRS [Deltaproteobacteria bacterium]|nr:tRNA glutamyl-Q(34) synthetase GluQRS [Deltaproteobacteria bacterium]
MTSPPLTSPVGRFAPSPTGALHTGSLATAVGSWLLARRAGGRWLVRMDDLDTPRQVAGMADDIRRTLEEFGLWWDREITRQSDNQEAYRDAFERLLGLGLVYPCGCSRREIAQAASAPHPDDDTLPYPATCRGGMRGGAVVRSWRVRAADGEICFDDLRRGRVCQVLALRCGDFVVRRGDGGFAYQLAVVLDDHLSGVTQVVRGDDLLASTPRQIYLQQLLGLPRPRYCHLPLVSGPGGAKLSKRDNLVSHHLGNWKGREGALLLALLRFLGQEPPGGLAGAACGEILQWGVDNFEVGRIPALGGELKP